MNLRRAYKILNRPSPDPEEPGRQQPPRRLFDRAVRRIAKRRIPPDYVIVGVDRRGWYVFKKLK